MTNRNIEYGLMDLSAQEKTWKPRPCRITYAVWERNEKKAQERRKQYQRGKA